MLDPGKYHDTIADMQDSEDQDPSPDEAEPPNHDERHQSTHATEQRRALPGALLCQVFMHTQYANDAHKRPVWARDARRGKLSCEGHRNALRPSCAATEAFSQWSFHLPYPAWPRTRRHQRRRPVAGAGFP